VITRLSLQLAAAALRLAHVAAMQRYRATGDDHWRQLALALMVSETQVRIRASRLTT